MDISLDEARVFAQAGNGGNGSKSFLRTKSNPMGGPDGGNGGNGGNVILMANQNLNTLLTFKYKRIFTAQNGISGKSTKRHGKCGANAIIKVPLGTRVFHATTKEMIADLTEHNQECTLAIGGKGGSGNVTFRHSCNRSPRQIGLGTEGEKGVFILSLSSLADVGLVGLPNAGKSSLLACTTAAKAKVAPYPFTTIRPQIGFVEVRNFDGFHMVDIPGIIARASDGVGMGKRFLKHIQRSKILLFLIDASSPNPLSDYQIINKEIEQYSKKLAKCKKIIALNKIDLLTPRKLVKLTNKIKEKLQTDVYLVSATTKNGIKEMLNNIFDYIEEERKKERSNTR
ncbi:MAG: GTPase ObgE [Alphaproteobacteria bacterium]|nr:GTPase ObgE [Rickettsiales bacterium]